jgi:2-oxoglutarate ferredoxin oxidoreductase subunit alpha
VHNEYGDTTEDPDEARRSVDKRMRKLEVASEELKDHGAILHGPKQADITIVGWGSTKGTILDAMEILKTKGIKVNFLQILFAQPFPVEKVTAILKKAKRAIMVEGNKTSQMNYLMREKTGTLIDDQLLFYDGQQPPIEDVVDHVLGVVK